MEESMPWSEVTAKRGSSLKAGKTGVAVLKPALCDVRSSADISQ